MKMTDKNLADKAIKIKWKDYVLVKDRIQYLSDNFEGRYSIETQYDYYPERKLWVVKAELTIWDEEHVNFCVYNGLAQEIETDKIWMVNTTSVLENCESSAIWRACAMAWIGILESIASADEMNKAFNREKAMEWPFKEEKKEEKGWYEKTLENTKFMLDTLDEDDFISKIKAWVAKIGEKMSADQEKKLRIAYKNAQAMNNISDILPD